MWWSLQQYFKGLKCVLKIFNQKILIKILQNLVADLLQVNAKLELHYTMQIKIYVHVTEEKLSMGANHVPYYIKYVCLKNHLGVHNR